MSQKFCLLLLNFKSIEFENHQIRCIVGKGTLLKLKWRSFLEVHMKKKLLNKVKESTDYFGLAENCIKYFLQILTKYSLKLSPGKS